MLLCASVPSAAAAAAWLLYVHGCSEYLICRRHEDAASLSLSVSRAKACAEVCATACATVYGMTYSVGRGI